MEIGWTPGKRAYSQQEIAARKKQPNPLSACSPAFLRGSTQPNSKKKFVEHCHTQQVRLYNTTSHTTKPPNDSQAATIAKSLGTEGNGNGTGDYLSANSSGSSAGFSGGDSNDAGSPDLEDNSNDGGRCDNPSSEGDGQASEAASSDYGGGTSSGSVSGDGNSAPRHNNNNGDADGNGNGNENGNNANRNGKLERKGCSGGGGERSSRKRARRVCAPVSTATVVPVPPRPGVGGGGGGGDWGWGGDPSHRLIPGAANELQQQKGAPGLRKAGGEKPAGSTARSDGRGGPGRGGVVGSLEREKRTATADRSPTSALAFLAAAAAEAAEATRAAPLSTTARRLALSAKKSILIRHGADSQS